MFDWGGRGEIYIMLLFFTSGNEKVLLIDDCRQTVLHDYVYYLMPHIRCLEQS